MAAKVQKTQRRRAKQQRSQATVDAILTAASQVLRRHGYAKASTDRIAERAGVSVGSLYQYFPNKDAVIEALFVRESKALGDRMAGFRPDPDLSLTENLSELISIGALNKDMDPILFHELAKITAFEARMESLRDSVVDAIVNFLDPYRDELAVQNPRRAAQLIVLSCEGVGVGATERMIRSGILDDLIEMSVSYLLSGPPRNETGASRT